MSRILVDPSNKVWKRDVGGGDIRIVKDRPFNQDIIQTGLSFWGRSDESLLTLVGGLVSEAYDVRDGYGGARKMVQGTAIRRYTYTSNSLYRPSSTDVFGLTKSNTTCYSGFIVCKAIGNTPIEGVGLISSTY